MSESIPPLPQYAFMGGAYLMTDNFTFTLPSQLSEDPRVIQNENVSKDIQFRDITKGKGKTCHCA
jgi:hypothetical protein